MSASPPLPPLPHARRREERELVDDELGRLLRKGVGLRVAVAPILGVLAIVVAWVDPIPWRMFTVGSLAIALMGLSVVVELRVRRLGREALNVGANFLAMAFFQLLMVVATGGATSPLAPVMLPLAMAAGISLGPGRAAGLVWLIQVGGLCAISAAQVLDLLPALTLAVLGPPPADTAILTSTLVMGFLLSASIALSTRLRSLLARVVRRGLDARDEQLRTLAATTRDLTALSGEIAHELKNPLASVKGLSALLARDVPEGRATERLEVMRGEVDRMQGILDEFLTFSRPLSPLALAEVELGALAQQVADLHEGVARARGVRLAVSGALSVRGDRRKLVQVLVNLVQNALDVAPGGSTVELAVGREGEDAVVEVLDRGPGLPAELGDRVFEAGVTGKETGSGLGLTIALGLIRQHGGALSLLDRSEGGTRARILIPLSGPPVLDAAAAR